MIENRSSPRASVMPVLAHPDVGEACEWLSAAFGFTVRLRIADHRAQLLYGERQYSAQDPGGHRSTFSQSIADVDPADWGGTLVSSA
jgi:hypothetical protein